MCWSACDTWSNGLILHYIGYPEFLNSSFHFSPESIYEMEAGIALWFKELRVAEEHGLNPNRTEP